MKRRHILGVTLLLLASMVFSACGNNSSSNAENEILVGGIYELTGSISSFGQSARNGIELAFEEINSDGGVLGKTLKLVIEDNKSQQADSATAAQKLIQQNKVVALLGPVSSANTLAIAPIAQQAKIPLITGTSTSPETTQIGDYIFRTCFIDPFQGKVMSTFAIENLGVKTAAIMIDSSSDYSMGLAAVFKETFEAQGGKIVSEVAFSSGDTDFNTILTTVKNAKPEAVFIPAYYDTVGLILDQAKNNVGFGDETQFLGVDGWDSPTLFELAGDSANGGYFSNHYSPEIDSPEVQSFVEAYKKKYNAVPDALAALCYDAAYVLAEAIEKSGTADPAAIRDALAKTDIVGVGGHIQLDENRNPIKSAVIIKVENQAQVYFTTIHPD